MSDTPDLEDNKVMRNSHVVKSKTYLANWVSFYDKMMDFTDGWRALDVIHLNFNKALGIFSNGILNSLR